MARKKQEIQLQRELESQEEWEEMLTKEGLTVIDVYQEWCGPCKAMAGNFRRIKNELGDDLLKFAVAKADTIDALEKYRGRCEPCFLFIASGVLVAVERGARSPYILRTLTEQLAREHKVLDGEVERTEIKDPLLAALEEKEKASKDEEETEKDDDDEEPVKKEVTVALLKPDVIQAGRAEEVLEQIRAAGIEILADEERRLTEEEAREFYGHLEGEEFFEELVQFITSGPSRVLVLTKGKTGENIIQEWRELLGPTNVEEAQEQSPDSLRSKFGQSRFMNALHGSDGKDSAARELAFFYPDFQVPNVPGTGRKLQRTVALIRPEAVEQHKDEIIAKIEEAGFTISFIKEIQLTKEQAQDFYKEHAEQDYFDELTTRMSNGPLIAMALAREDAVNEWRKCLGPKEKEKLEEEPDSFRAKFDVPDSPFNALHGSDSTEAAKREMEMLFPMQQTLAVIKPDSFQTREDIIDRIHEAGFKIAARKETQLSREFVEIMYPEIKDKEFFTDLCDYMTSGPTMFMVLSREDAVAGWRSLIGPTDPSVAKETSPNSIRAQFGSDIKANAVHGSSTVEAAKDAIKSVFERIEEKKEEGEAAGEAEQTEEGGQETGEQQQQEGEQTEQQQEGDQPAATDGDEAEQEKKDEQEEQDTHSGDEAQAEDKQEEETEGSPKPGSPGGRSGSPGGRSGSPGGRSGSPEGGSGSPGQTEDNEPKQEEQQETAAEPTEEQQQPEGEQQEQQEAGGEEKPTEEQKTEENEQKPEASEQQEEKTEESEKEEKSEEKPVDSTEETPAEQTEEQKDEEKKDEEKKDEEKKDEEKKDTEKTD